MAKQKSNYVDGFVLAVPKKKIGIYKKMAKEGEKIWKKHGAIDYKECMADDMRAQWSMPFPKLVKPKKDEVIMFSFITYKSRKHRDAVNKKVMSDPSMNDPEIINKEMPFDMKRMAYGGFKVIVG